MHRLRGGKLSTMKNILFCLALGTLLLASCAPYHKIGFTGEAQGTYYAVTYFDRDNRNLQPEIDSLLKRFDQSASLWVPGSVISLINESDTGGMADEIVDTLLKMSIEVAKSSGGCFDFTVGPLVNAWGFGFRQGIMPDSNKVDSLMQYIGFDKVSLESGLVRKEMPEVSIDFNAIAQGYSVDLVGDFLESKGISDYLVDIGGEVLAGGHKPDGDEWVVGVEKPSEDPYTDRELQISIALEDKAIATSGSYRKFFMKDGIRYSHTINPVSGYPVGHSLLSVSVIAGDCATADAYATAFMVMGVEESMDFLSTRKDLDAYFIFSDGDGVLQTTYSKGFEELILN